MVKFEQTFLAEKYLSEINFASVKIQYHFVTLLLRLGRKISNNTRGGEMEGVVISYMFGSKRCLISSFSFTQFIIHAN